MKSFEPKHLNLTLTLTLLFAVAALAGDARDTSPPESENPGMLDRVQRSPGILPDDPSEMPNGEQAHLYYDLLETDPENTSFKEEWESR